MAISAFGRDDWQWLNEPARWSTEDGLTVVADAGTDFWRTTHYGFDRDTGHVLGVPLEGDFTLVAYFPPAVRTLAGVMAAAPDGPGFTARFDRVRVASA